MARHGWMNSLVTSEAEKQMGHAKFDGVGSHDTVHCALCRQADMLPEYCSDCGEAFCRDCAPSIRGNAYHDCSRSKVCRPAGPAAAPAPALAAARPKSKRCAARRCKTRLHLFEHRCDECGLSFCAEHRHPQDHRCGCARRGGDAGSAAAGSAVAAVAAVAAAVAVAG